MLYLAIKAVTTVGRLCFIIDSLNKFNSKHINLINFIISLAYQNINIKICILS